MAYLNNMKLGWIGANYPAPADVTDPVDKIMWQLEQAKRLGCQVLQPLAPLPKNDPDALAKIKAKMKEYDIEFELGVPRAIFELAGPYGVSAKMALQAEIDFVKAFGDVKIMRCGYGKLVMETTRYSKETAKAQYDNLRECLKIAAPMFEKAGIYFALENHLDFTGQELAAIFAEINSPYMGIAVDTANGFCIFSEPTEESLAMAPWAITSHIKDAKIVDKTQEGDYFPLIPLGCACGEGSVDIPKIIDAIATKSRYPEGFHLIVEQGWFGPALDEIKDEEKKNEFRRNTIERSISYLKELITVK